MIDRTYNKRLCQRDQLLDKEKNVDWEALVQEFKKVPLESY